MKMLIYLSRATQPMNAEDLQQLLDQSRRNNEQVNITGLLLYQAGCFLQALEGEAQPVTELYDRISKDPRHTDLNKLYDQPIDKRNFGDWSMGFHLVDKAALENSEGFSNILDEPMETTDIDLAHEMTFSMVSLFKQYVRRESAPA